VSSLYFSETTCHLNERAQLLCQCVPFQTSEMGDIHVYFIRSVTPTPRSEPSKLQNLHRNSAAGLPKKNSQPEQTDILALSNASPITLQTNGVNVCGCVFV